jgi:O-antigen/teichoic acid export membrane protein
MALFGGFVSSGAKQSSAVDSATDGPAGRKRRLLLSIALAFVSKFTALVVQLTVLPIALSTLGTLRYGLFLSLQSTFAWFGLAGLGLSIILPRSVSAAVMAGDKPAERSVVLSALTILLCAGAAIAVLMLIVGAIATPARLLGLPKGLNPAGLGIAFSVGVLTCSARFVAAIDTAVRSGYQELHRVYVLTTIAGIANMILVASTFPTHGQIWTLFAMMHGPFVALSFADLLYLLSVQRPHLMRGDWQFSHTLETLLPNGLNALLKQVSYFLMSSGATVTVLHFEGVRKVAGFGSLMTLLVLFASGFGAVYQPLLSAMAHAHCHGDRRWFKKAYLAGLGLTLAAAGALIVIAATVGPWLCVKWLHADLAITRLLCTALAFYFLFWILSDYHFFIVASMGKLTGLGKLYLLEGPCALLAGISLIPWFGVEGLAIGLAIGAGCFGAIFLPLRAWKLIDRDGWDCAAAAT